MNKTCTLAASRRIHMIGIGGSGMNPLADILAGKGHIITGTDNYESDTLLRTREKGIQVKLGHSSENISGADLVAYSAAINPENPELLAARNSGIPCMERSELLGAICAQYSEVVGISGTHGKTTTTGMLAQILIGSDLDPTVVLGGESKLLGGNSRVGKSSTIVCEACEYVDSFLQLHPTISAILNLEADHLDYFKSLDNLIHSFHRFAQQTQNFVVVNGDDENALKAALGIPNKVATFGLSKNCTFRAENLTENPGAVFSFTFTKNDEHLGNVSLQVPGLHNVYNALAAASISNLLGVPFEKIAENLMLFQNVGRRFEHIGEAHGVTVKDDFAHHPTEIATTLTAAGRMGFARIIAVFQPHTFSRTAMFLKEFAEALSIADMVIVSEILPVREQNTYNIYSEDLARLIPGCICLKTFEEIRDFVAANARSGDLVLTMGGGNVYKCARMIHGALKTN